MRGAISPLPQYAFMAWCSVKSRTTLALPLSLEWFVGRMIVNELNFVEFFSGDQP
jgi:hypothetical protein